MFIWRRVLNRGDLLLCSLNELENGLAVPWEFTAFTKSVAIGQKLKEEITHIKELLKAHGYRNMWKWLNGRETIPLYWFCCCQSLSGYKSWFSLYPYYLRGERGGCVFAIMMVGGCFIWGTVPFRAWELIQGITVLLCFLRTGCKTVCQEQRSNWLPCGIPCFAQSSP